MKFFAWAFYILLTFQVGCISINLPKDEVKRSDSIRLTPPPAPFKELQSENIDGGWRNNLNGNSISYLTNCKDPSDPSLKSVRSEVIGKLDSPKIISEVNFDFNKRAALRSHILSHVDGLKSEFDIVILKKDSCIYIINYIATEPTYQQDLEVFDRFLKEFQVN